MGGALSVQMALEYPQRVSAIVVAEKQIAHSVSGVGDGFSESDVP
jgi:hypothetical protein